MLKVGKKNATSNSNFDLIVGRNSTIEGNVKSEGSIRVDGKVDGDIVTTGDVIIGNEAETNGQIEGFNIEISGKVDGDVKAEGSFRIFESGQLFGNINVKSFVIDEGGVFEGMCHINAENADKSHHKPKNKKYDTSIKRDTTKDDKKEEPKEDKKEE